MSLSLFIPLLVIFTFIDERIAADPANFVEQIMRHACVDVLGITEKRKLSKFALMNRASTIKKVTLAFPKLFTNKSLMEDVIRLHILLKVVAGTTEVHKSFETLESYLLFCDELAEKDKAEKEKENKEGSSKSGKRVKEGESSVHHHAEKSGQQHKGKQKDANFISMVLEHMGLSADDWQNLTKEIPKFTWKPNPAGKVATAQTPFEFGFSKQEIAEKTMKDAFNSIIEESPEKRENLYKLCHQIEEFACRVYKAEIEKQEEKKFGNFCKNFKPNDSASEAQSSGAVEADTEIE